MDQVNSIFIYLENTHGSGKFHIYVSEEQTWVIKFNIYVSGEHTWIR